MQMHELLLLNTLTADERAIRESVFIREQGFVNEFDDIDDTAVHAVIYCEDKPAACGRLYTDADGVYHIGRIAVMRKMRGAGLGGEIMDILERKARTLGASEVRVSAQVRAARFYERLGYLRVGAEYLDEECLHICMVKRLD